MNEENDNAIVIWVAVDKNNQFVSALVDIGISESLVSRKWMQSLEFIGELEVYKEKRLTANSTSMPVKGKAELVVQPENIKPNFGIVFLISAVDKLQCLLVRIFLRKMVAIC